MSKNSTPMIVYISDDAFCCCYVTPSPIVNTTQHEVSS